MNLMKPTKREWESCAIKQCVLTEAMAENEESISMVRAEVKKTGNFSDKWRNGQREVSENMFLLTSQQELTFIHYCAIMNQNCFPWMLLTFASSSVLPALQSSKILWFQKLMLGAVTFTVAKCRLFLQKKQIVHL